MLHTLRDREEIKEVAAKAAGRQKLGSKAGTQGR
jgi:hypothetical protein